MKLAKFFVPLFVITTLCGGTVFAQKTSDKTAMEAERKKLQLELKQIQQSYNAVKGLSKDNLHQIAALNKKIELQEKYINNIGKEIHLIDDDIYYSAVEIKKLKNQMDTLKAQYARTVVYAYKNRSNYDYLNFIFSANSFNDAIRRVAYLKSYRGYREKQMEDIRKTSKLIDKRYEHQLASKNQKQNALTNRTQEFANLETQKSEKDSVAKLLQSQAGNLQQQIAKKKEQDRQLKSSITAIVRQEIAEARRIAREEARKKAAADAKARTEALERQRLADAEKALAAARAREIAAPAPPPKGASGEPAENKPLLLPKATPVNPGKASAIRAVPKRNTAISANSKPITIARNTPPPQPAIENKPPAGGYLNYQASDIALNGDFAQNRGRLPHPVDNGAITLGFGRYKIDGIGPDIVGDNPGVTYTAPVGAAVKAVFTGEVVSISRVGGMSFVVLRHGKYFTAYSNLASTNVNKGAAVARGQVIGTVGADEDTGNGKLDFILMIEERNVDPRGWLR